ncbi:MAG: N-acetylmuramoyl-L-alanine amidase [Lachnospiraceae bacterium]|nr:N-acetylmuramoyl-L-alanine amidase [Lachnospiraceae bacterium]MDE6984243.1 N-acetylmuramoyl-L-alanine amidase [Lachnospiraceae bacterium]
MSFTNSPLVVYKKISPNRTSPRNHKIDTISIHCMACNASVESCGNNFAVKSRNASSNYGIGSDGRIAMYVEEKDRSWCSSNAANDHRAVTIEVANDGGAPEWHISDKAYDALVNLCTDICKRNGIKELRWRADRFLIGQPDKQNMTVHRWFANKSCPGDYLYNLHGRIAADVNRRLINTNPLDIIQPANPYAEPAINVKKGSRGESAKWVQWCLWRFGLLDKTGIDGVIGIKSEEAIRTAQKQLGCTADGIVGKNTRQAFKRTFVK